MKIYYQPNGGISFLPDILGLGEIKVFGCPNIQDYGEGAILFDITKNAPNIMEKEIKNFCPDFVFVESFTLPMIEALHKVRRFFIGKIVGFWGDCLLDQSTLEILYRAGKYCNRLYVVDKFAEIELQKRGIQAEFTVQPASGAIYQHKPGVTAEYDVILAGNPYLTWGMPNADQRIKLAQMLSKKDRVGIFGNQSWSEYGISSKGWVDEYKLNDIYNRTKIVITCDSVIDKPYFTSVRTYNVLCSGTFLLIRKFDGIEDLFVNRKHLVWYETNEEALYLVDYYLDHEEKREEIAQEGMNLVHEIALKRNLFSKWINTGNDQFKGVSFQDNLRDLVWTIKNQIHESSLRIRHSLSKQG